MSKALRRRLAKLEARVPPWKRVIIVTRIVNPGTFGGDDWDRAETVGGDEVWTRNPGESVKEFEDRVVADLSKRESSAFGIQVLLLPREEP